MSEQARRVLATIFSGIKILSHDNFSGFQIASIIIIVASASHPICKRMAMEPIQALIVDQRVPRSRPADLKIVRK